MRPVAVIASSIFLAVVPLGAETTLWRCADPAHPFRFVTSEEMKDDPPPCNAWVQLRGKNLEYLLNALAAEPHEAANFFLADGAGPGEFFYPGAASGDPVATGEIYAHPERYGFEVAPAEDAPVGSVVVYDGLGGVLVESRRSEAEEWVKQVLYPSKAAGFELTVSDLDIAGKQQPKVLVRKSADSSESLEDIE